MELCGSLFSELLMAKKQDVPLIDTRCVSSVELSLAFQKHRVPEALRVTGHDLCAFKSQLTTGHVMSSWQGDWSQGWLSGQSRSRVSFVLGVDVPFKLVVQVDLRSMSTWITACTLDHKNRGCRLRWCQSSPERFHRRRPRRVAAGAGAGPATPHASSHTVQPLTLLRRSTHKKSWFYCSHRTKAELSIFVSVSSRIHLLY